MSNVLRKSIVVTILSVATIVQGAEFEAHPSLAVIEEFTDNVFETNTNRISDYITRTLPGLALSFRAPVLNGDLNYVFDYRHYARKNRGDEITHILSANGHLTAVENFMYLDVSDEYQRVSLDVTRDVTKESLFLNQSDRNVATVSPYMTLRVTERIPLKFGYRFVNTRYFDSVGIDKTDHIAFLDMSYELSKRFSLTAGYTFIRETADIDNFSQHQGLGGFRYEYADKSFLFAQAGYTWTNYDSGQRLNSIAWNAGITHAFDTVTGTVTTGVRYDEDPLRNIMKETFVSGTIVKRLNRSSFSLSSQYSEYIPTKTDPLQTTTISLKTKKYGATASCQYEFTADLNGRLGITAEQYEYPQLDNHTRRYQVDSGLSYLLAKQLSFSLSYIYVDYSSSGIVADNKRVNRAMIELKKIY